MIKRNTAVKLSNMTISINQFFLSSWTNEVHSGIRFRGCSLWVQPSMSSFSMLYFKYVFERLLALTLMVFCTPVWILTFIITKCTSSGPFLFKQKRLGKNKKTVCSLQNPYYESRRRETSKKYQKLNEADGPVLKFATILVLHHLENGYHIPG